MVAVAVLAALGAGAALVAAWAVLGAAIPVVPDVLVPTYHLVPLAGDPLADTADRAYWDPPPPTEAMICLEALAPLTAHPHWQVRVAEEWSDCEGSSVPRVLTIDADGGVTWEAPELPTRHLTLTADELARVRGLGLLSCALLDRYRRGAGFVVTYGADPGPARTGYVGFERTEGAHVPESSVAGVVLGEILDAATARYDRARLAELGDVTLDLTAMPLYRDHWSSRAARYRVRLGPGRVFSVRRGRRELASEVVPVREVVDLADWALANPVGLASSSDDLVRGRLVVGGRAIPIAATEWQFPHLLSPAMLRVNNALAAEPSR